MNNILKQTITNMRQQPLLTGLTIAGTALSICLIMIVMMTREAQIIDYGCEPYRSRTMYATYMELKSGSCQIYSSLKMEHMRGIFLKLKTPERIALFSSSNTVSACTQGNETMNLKIQAVNQTFFEVFPLRFTEGTPFTEEECNSNMPIAIISQTVGRNLFGQDKNLKGKPFLIENHEYRVAGVVEDVSPLLTSAYSEIWVPVGITPGVAHPLENVLYPEYSIWAALLAKSSDDFPKIKGEVERNLAAYNKAILPDTLNLLNQPDTQEEYVNRIYANEEPDLQSIHLRYALIFAILLIVPAINLTSMAQSQLQRRREEIGIRRAFGAKRSTIMIQTFAESLVQTIAAGALGLVLCLVACFCLSNYVFPTTQLWFEDTTDTYLDMDILFSPLIYGWTMLFCLILNILSNTLPAWMASRTNIVEALK